MESKFQQNRVPALPDLFAITQEGVRLMSARCHSCGTFFFPRYHEQHRPGCNRQGVENVLLNREGKLASYTIQFYMPPPPFKTDKDITPYVIGLVEFPEGIQVTGIVLDCPHDRLKLGLSVETTLFTLYRDEKDQEVVTWAFRPTGL